MLKGSIEVICGPMFCGKSEELIRRLRRAEIANLNVEVFKPTIDTRYSSEEEVVTHRRERFPCHCIKFASDIAGHVVPDAEVVGIDEAQFFGEKLVQMVEWLADAGIRVIVAGLDQDYTGKPFGPMPELMARADKVLKLSAVCTSCGAEATKTYKKKDDGEQVAVGEKDLYEARCRSCWGRASTGEDHG